MPGTVSSFRIDFRRFVGRDSNRIGRRAAACGETYLCGLSPLGKPGERFPKSWRHEVEKTPQFQRHHVAGNVNQLDRHRVELEGIQHDLELAGVDSFRNVIVQQLREPETMNRGVDGCVGRRNLQSRRNGNGHEPRCVRTSKAPVRRQHWPVEHDTGHFR